MIFKQLTISCYTVFKARLFSLDVIFFPPNSVLKDYFSSNETVEPKVNYIVGDDKHSQLQQLTPDTQVPASGCIITDLKQILVTPSSFPINFWSLPF